jgi:hypothetical protein
MENEKNKEDRFIRIAERRTNTILETLRLLGNCSNTNNYKFTDQQEKKIFNAIEQEVRITKIKFEKIKVNTGNHKLFFCVCFTLFGVV